MDDEMNGDAWPPPFFESSELERLLISDKTELLHVIYPVTQRPETAPATNPGLS